MRSTSWAHFILTTSLLSFSSTNPSLSVAWPLMCTMWGLCRNNNFLMSESRIPGCCKHLNESLWVADWMTSLISLISSAVRESKVSTSFDASSSKVQLLLIRFLSATDGPACSYVMTNETSALWKVNAHHRRLRVDNMPRTVPERFLSASSTPSSFGPQPGIFRACHDCSLSMVL